MPKLKPSISSSDHYDARGVSSLKEAKKREDEFREWFCSQLKLSSIWHDRSEPGGYGQRHGRPDLELLLRGELVPVEVKITLWIEDGKLKMTEVRPPQINWHREFAHHYGRSYFMGGIWNAETKAWGFAIARSEVVTGELFNASSSRCPILPLDSVGIAHSMMRQFDTALSSTIAEADKAQFLHRAA